MKKYTFLLIVGLAAITSLTAQKTTTHFSKEAKYKISYPEDWSIIDNSISPLLNFGASSPLDTVDDVFSENFNVVIDNSDLTGISLEEYTRLSGEGISAYLKSVKIISNEMGTSNTGTPCGIIVYSHVYNKYSLKVLVYIYFAHNKAYVVTCSAETNSFDAYKPRFVEICKSVEFTK